MHPINCQKTFLSRVASSSQWVQVDEESTNTLAEAENSWRKVFFTPMMVSRMCLFLCFYSLNFLLTKKKHKWKVDNDFSVLCCCLRNLELRKAISIPSWHERKLKSDKNCRLEVWNWRWWKMGEGGTKRCQGSDWECHDNVSQRRTPFCWQQPARDALHPAALVLLRCSKSIWKSLAPPLHVKAMVSKDYGFPETKIEFLLWQITIVQNLVAWMVHETKFAQKIFSSKQTQWKFLIRQTLPLP